MFGYVIKWENKLFQDKMMTIMSVLYQTELYFYSASSLVDMALHLDSHDIKPTRLCSYSLMLPA